MTATTGTRAMDHVRALSVDIGPRPPTGDGERLAARYVGRTLRSLGAEVEEQRFRANRSFSHPFGIIYSLGALAGLLVPWWPAIGAVLGVTALTLFWLEVDTRGAVWLLFAVGHSVNVIGRFAARKEARARVVITAHHDTSRSALLFSPSQVGGFRRAFLAMAACFILIPLLAGAAAALDAPASRLAGLAAVIPALYLLGSVAILVHRELVGVDVAGANDNASGVAVMLEVAETFPLDHVDVWVVSTGAEEAGCVGARELAARHGEELRDALFINIDNVGAGNPRYTTYEGMLTRFPSDPDLVSLAESVAKELPDLGFDGVANTIMSTDAVPLMARGFRVISLRAEDDQRLLPHWHWPTDVCENVEPGTIAAMVGFTRALLGLVDVRGGVCGGDGMGGSGPDRGGPGRTHLR